MTTALFATTLAIQFLATTSSPTEAPDPLERAWAHPVERDRASESLIEGAFLGNGR
jgi:hypothetical protein